MSKCKHADEYRGIHKPRCGCTTCKDIYIAAQMRKLLDMGLGDDPMVVRYVAMNVLDVIENAQSHHEKPVRFNDRP